LKKSKFLTREEERALADRSAAGDVRAMHALVLAHAPLAEKFARKYGKGRDIDDVRQDAYIGLMQAARKFEPEREHRFATYAVHWMRAAIFDAIVTGDEVRGPRTQAGRSDRLRGIQVATMASIETPIGPNGLTLGDTLVSDDPTPEEIVTHAVDLDRRSTGIEMAVESLDPRSADIVRRRYLLDDPHTLDQCGTDYQISRERVRQIESKALKVLAKRLNPRSATICE
jgi:RNA polymerase sigma-32 factor